MSSTGDQDDAGDDNEEQDHIAIEGNEGTTDYEETGNAGNLSFIIYFTR